METRQSQIQTLCDLADAVLGGIKPPTAEQVEAVRQAMCTSCFFYFTQTPHITPVFMHQANQILSF